MTTISRTSRLVFAAAALALALAGCSAPATESSTALAVDDAWVKTAESGMSAAFGTLSNSTDNDLVVVSASTPASSEVQLHETIEDADGQMVMQEKDGGFVIPAHGSFTLEPGGNHIMLMDLAAPIVAGDEVSFTLTLEDGSTVDFTAPGKDFTGADETYVGGDDMSGMDMGN